MEGREKGRWRGGGERARGVRGQSLGMDTARAASSASEGHWVRALAGAGRDAGVGRNAGAARTDEARRTGGGGGAGQVAGGPGRGLLGGIGGEGAAGYGKGETAGVGENETSRKGQDGRG